MAALISLGLALPVAAAPVAARPDPYAAGMRQVQQAIANGDLNLAERTTQQLSKRYANNVELLTVRARVLFWQKRYAESIASFKKAQKLKPGPELTGELNRVLVAQQLAEADRLAAEKQNARAQKILVGLFESGKEPYESGLRLSRLRMSGGDYRGASQVLTRLLQQYPRERDLVVMNARALLSAGAPDEALAFLTQRAETAKDPELLAMRGRSLMRLKRYAEAAESFRSSLALADDAEVRVERERAETGSLLERADRLLAAGDTAQATPLLRGAFESGRDRYGAGTRLAAIYTRTGNAEEASRVYLLLMYEYPKDTELAVLYARSLVNTGRKEAALAVLNALQQKGDDARVSALRGRILLMKGEYRAAEQEYEKAQRLGVAAPEIAAERGEAETALKYQRLRELLDAKDYQGARPLLESLTAGGPYAREARLLTVKVLLARRQVEEAVSYSGNLYREHPEDPELAALYAEALLRAGEESRAQDVLDRLDVKGRATLVSEKEDLFYRARGNWVKVFGGAYEYSGRFGAENVAGVTVSRRFRPLTAVATASETTRFGNRDPQLALDLYQARTPGRNLYGSLSFTLSPGADFLPRYSAGLELTRPFSSLEVSAAYNRLEFDKRGASVMSAALIWYLPRVLMSLGERIYFSPANSTAFSVTTFRWDPDNRLGAFAALGLGNSSERVGAEEDLQRYDTYSLRGGAEYRFSPSYSVGGESSFESRRGLYDRYGATVFVKYWWP